jgi:hypothetical protein
MEFYTIFEESINKMDIKPSHKALEQMLIKIFKEFFIIGVEPTYQ